MSSVYSSKTGRSILKVYAPSERDKVKNAIINKVRFDMPREKGLLGAVNAVCECNNYQSLNEFVCFIRETQLSDIEFMIIMTDARKIVHTLSPKFTNLVEALLSLSWTKRGNEAVTAYTEFCMDIMVVHSKYVHFGVNKLIALWIPSDTDAELWPNGSPEPQSALHLELDAVHKILERILNAIPMTFDMLLDAIDVMFPYYKKAPHVMAGYVHNLLRLIEYKPIYTEFVVQLLLKKLVILDVNAPRCEIEEAECDEDEEGEEDVGNDKLTDCMDEPIFEMDDLNKESTEQLPMNHPIAQTLDICMAKVCEFLAQKTATSSPPGLNQSEDQKLLSQKGSLQFLKVLLNAFDNVILPSHNTHHVQFLIFYYCSFRSTLAETFLASLWDKFKNPNVSAVIRQAAVGYIASFLARAKFLSIAVVRHYLKELSDWAHQYIERCDQFRANGSLKANLVFFCVCQAIFYVISFRSRDLTVDKRSLLFLQGLHLSALVTCNLNPLRVCLPPVATAFAGVTRAYQLAYCHAILERNARRKLATVYANDTATPEEMLDTFFPFDPCLLKITGIIIEPHYLQYKASEAEEQASIVSIAANDTTKLAVRRKRGDSEMLDDVDEFLLVDKRQKLLEMAKSLEREEQFTYGLSPGFQM